MNKTSSKHYIMYKSSDPAYIFTLAKMVDNAKNKYVHRIYVMMQIL